MCTTLVFYILHIRKYHCKLLLVLLTDCVYFICVQRFDLLFRNFNPNSPKGGLYQPP